MAAGKACFCVFAIVALLLLILDLSAPVYAEGISLGQLQVLHKDRHLLGINCGKACEGRCAAAGRKKRCLRFCGICCSKCQCVPPGTYGNKDACPCYRDLKNDRGTSKCP